MDQKSLIPSTSVGLTAVGDGAISSASVSVSLYAAAVVNENRQATALWFDWSSPSVGGSGSGGGGGGGGGDGDGDGDRDGDGASPQHMAKCGAPSLDYDSLNAAVEMQAQRYYGDTGDGRMGAAALYFDDDSLIRSVRAHAKKEKHRRQRAERRERAVAAAAAKCGTSGNAAGEGEGEGKGKVQPTAALVVRTGAAEDTGTGASAAESKAVRALMPLLDRNGQESSAAVMQMRKTLREEAEAEAAKLEALDADGSGGALPQWRCMRVIAGHKGWVRSVAVDPTNDFFVSGSTDATIKVWDLASGRLRLTLLGHTHAVRSCVLSDRHPYLFSAGGG